MQEPIFQTREQWLSAFLSFWTPHSERLNYPLPPVKVSCGWPARGALSEKRPKFGDTWPWQTSEEGITEIFISPLLSDPINVCAALIHQLGFACFGKQEKAKIKAYMQAAGLVGKPNEAGAGPELIEFLEKNLEQFGAYPHARIDPAKIAKERKKGECRVLKVECPAPQCGYSVRTSKKNILRGLPTCPCGTVMRGPDFDADGEIVPEAACGK